MKKALITVEMANKYFGKDCVLSPHSAKNTTVVDSEKAGVPNIYLDEVVSPGIILKKVVASSLGRLLYNWNI